ncbi:MAG: hypothetical protein ACK4ZE_12630, partial [Sphingorhabdus sp.]
MKHRLLLLSAPLLCCQPLVSNPLAAAGNQYGWCKGVGNPHKSNSCSSTTQVIQTGTVVQTPTVNQTPQPQIVVPTPSQLPFIPKRLPENRTT